MKYVGSKNRHAKELLKIILKDRKPGQWYVEPFVGGANMIDKVDGNRIGSDTNRYLIALLTYMQSNGFSAPSVDERLYRNVKGNKDDYPDWFVGYVGFCLSFGAKWFGGYRRDNVGYDYNTSAQRNITKQVPAIKGVQFHCLDYWDLDIPDNSIVYCDPPYADTTKYAGNKDKFDHEKFWKWASELSKHHRVFVSEYNAPDDWECVWTKDVPANLAIHNQKRNQEKLFIYKGE